MPSTVLGNESQTNNTTPSYKELILANANVTQSYKYYSKSEIQEFRENTWTHTSLSAYVQNNICIFTGNVYP